jgi:alpha-tubulin suppressor-like RCC1 family protein
LADHTIKCWGDNSSGQLGDGSINNSLSPVFVSGINNAVSVSAGNQHACALLSDQTIKCWGFGSSGQLGYGSISNINPIPVLVSGISTATSLNLYSLGACATLADQTVKCWGSNYTGQFGNGDFMSSSRPVYRLTRTEIDSLSFNSTQSQTQCIVSTVGQVHCSGSNSKSQTGFDENLIRNVSGF